jgi:hypothetical protein
VTHVVYRIVMASTIIADLNCWGKVGCHIGIV